MECHQPALGAHAQRRVVRDELCPQSVALACADAVVSASCLGHSNDLHLLARGLRVIWGSCVVPHMRGALRLRAARPHRATGSRTRTFGYTLDQNAHFGYRMTFFSVERFTGKETGMTCLGWGAADLAYWWTTGGRLNY